MSRRTGAPIPTRPLRKLAISNVRISPTNIPLHRSNADIERQSLPLPAERLNGVTISRRRLRRIGQPRTPADAV